MDTPCILWTGATNPKGYGQRRIKGKTIAVHRLTWEQHNGPIPGGMEIMHTCNVRNCINIEHLQLGTHQENLDYKHQLNRQWSKVTKEQIQEIRLGYMMGQTTNELMKEFGLSYRHVRRIVSGR